MQLEHVPSSRATRKRIPAFAAVFPRLSGEVVALVDFAGRRPDAVLPGQVGSSLHRPGVERFAQAYRQEVQLTATERALLPALADAGPADR